VCLCVCVQFFIVLVCSITHLLTRYPPTAHYPLRQYTPHLTEMMVGVIDINESSSIMALHSFVLVGYGVDEDYHGERVAYWKVKHAFVCVCVCVCVCECGQV
jgi:hypothetical protein